MRWKTIQEKCHYGNKRQAKVINEYIDWYENNSNKKKVFLTCKGGHFVYGLLGGVKNSRHKTIYRTIDRKWRGKNEQQMD